MLCSNTLATFLSKPCAKGLFDSLAPRLAKRNLFNKLAYVAPFMPVAFINGLVCASDSKEMPLSLKLSATASPERPSKFAAIETTKTPLN